MPNWARNDALNVMTLDQKRKLRLVANAVRLAAWIAMKRPTALMAGALDATSIFVGKLIVLQSVIARYAVKSFAWNVGLVWTV